MKIKKSNLTIYILTSAAFISLIGVGFSSWVLDKIQGDSQQINAEIGKIIDNSLIASIDKESSELDDPIRFDANNDNGGIVANGDSEVSENMDFVVAFNIEAGYALNGGDIEIKFTFDDIAKKYSTCLDTTPLDDKPQYIDTSCLKEFAFRMPPSNDTIDNTSKTISSVVTYSNENKSAKVVSTFTFKRGKAFEYKNPCASEDINVIETLKAFDAAFSQIGSDKAFTVTITPSKKASSL